MFLQNTAGTLESYVSYFPLSTGIHGVLKGFAIADLNGDGLNDLVASGGGNQPDAKLAIWYQDSILHTFPSCIQIPAYEIPSPVVVADLDCDGRPEIIVGHFGWEAYSIFVQDSLGQFGPYQLNAIPYASFKPQSLSVADLDDDGRKDLVFANGQNGLTFCRNTSLPAAFDSTFLVAVSVDTTWSDTAFAVDYDYVEVVDTVDWAIIRSIVAYEVHTDTLVDTLRTETVWERFGTICGANVIDTLHLYTWEAILTPLPVDTLPPYIAFVDTLNVGIDDPAQGDLSLFPSPTNGVINLRSSGSPPHGFTFVILDGRGAVIRKGTVGAWPCAMDLGALPNGRYFFIGGTAHHPRSLMRTIVVAH